jgi:hypothetical protein
MAGLWLDWKWRRSERIAVRRFPEQGDEELLAGPSGNFQILDPGPASHQPSGPHSDPADLWQSLPFRCGGRSGARISAV